MVRNQLLMGKVVVSQNAECSIHRCDNSRTGRFDAWM